MSAETSAFDHSVEAKLSGTACSDNMRSAVANTELFCRLAWFIGFLGPDARAERP